ncbi:MAG: aminotransferase DegT [Betaproteobacteria bacterium]|jgi:perosamine synthetase|nr:aminotransferase DegT [Betaproteobacteria bacterium]
MTTPAGRSSTHDVIVDAVKRVLPDLRSPVALHEPSFGGNEWQYVKECIDTKWVSSAGKYVDRFEEMLKGFTGAGYAVATVNGTAALHACLLLTGVEHGDEVLIPALTFIATANAVSYTGARPHLVDSDTATLGVDASKLDHYLRETAAVRDGVCRNLRTGAVIRALVPMHTFGHPVDLDAITALCARWQIQLVEDAAESLGSYYRGRHTGNFGTVAALSFNGNKVITTGGGGAILTNDPALAKLAKHITTTARTAHRWSFMHDQVGYNYRLPNLNAALGCAQVEQLPGFLESKRALAQRYFDAFEDVSGVSIMREPAHCRSNYWLNALLLDRPDVAVRDRLLETLNGLGIMARPVWTLMHRLPVYADCPRMDLAQAEALDARIVNLPSSPFLAD